MKRDVQAAAATGARPQGASDERTAAAAVQSMFDAIAPRYDLLNRMLSAGVDVLWRRRVARTFREILAEPDATIVDLCCGTGDLALALLRYRPPGARPVLAVDFSHQMLLRLRPKLPGRNLVAVEGDAMRLPFPGSSVSLIVAAFGFRNLVNYDAALRELYRVLRPGGRLGILEAAEPGGLFGSAYRLYFHRLLPRIGALLSGNAGAYAYLPSSVARFPAPPLLQQKMTAAGFAEVRWSPFSMGIAGLFTGTRPAVPSQDIADARPAL